MATSGTTPNAGERTIGHYRLLRKLGAGGMGEVYLAEDSTLKRPAAVKLLPAEVAGDSAWRKRFLQEARTASALNHASIATIYEAGAEGDLAYMAMEYVEGVTPRERLKRPLPVQEAVGIARQVAQALAVAHRAGIVHHDIKPANIMLPTGGGVKVLDFGLARRQLTPGSATEGQTQTQVTATAAGAGSGFSGTPGYAAPEQLQPGATDARADLFALGAVLYEMLAGRPPFPGRNVFEVCHAVLAGTPPPVGSLRRDTPPALSRLVARCLEKDRAARHQCAADLALDLEVALQQGPDLVSRGADRGRRRLWMAAAALLLGIALGASLLLWRRPQRTYWKLPTAPPKHVLRHSGDVLGAGLAPDGSQFAYILKGELYLQAIGGGEPRKLTDDATFIPRFSPDGNRIIFVRGWSKPALYVLDLPAGIPRLLVEEAESGLWSPDGSKLAFIRPRPGELELFVADAQGRQPRSLGPVKRHNPRYPGFSWAPDGKSLAVAHDKKIYVVSVDGGSRRELAGSGGLAQAGVEDVKDVVFTPDGEFIIAQFWRADGWSLWQLPARGGVPVPFLVGPYHSDLTISRDGRKVLVGLEIRESHIMVAEVAAERAQGKGIRQITFGGTMQSDVALSPDERRIAYLERGGGQLDIWIADTDGTDARQLTVGADRPRGPTWSPDGKTIAFSSERKGELWTVRLAEGRPQPFPTVEGEKGWTSYTSDGKHIVFQVTKKHARDIWLAPVEAGQARALTNDGASMAPRASPVGTAVAYLRKTAPDSYEVRILDYASRQDRLVATPEALSKFGRFPVHSPRWSRDSRHLFLAAELGVLRVRAEGGSPEKFSFPLGYREDFEVFSDQRRIMFAKETFSIQPRLYDDLQ